MKKKDAASLGTLRLLWSAIRTEEINEKKTLDDDGVLAIVSRQIKQLLDAMKDFETGGRADLVERAKAELALLGAYMPAQMSDEELAATVRRVIADAVASGAKDIGRVMGAVMKEVKGKADGNRVRQKALELLG